ncbi:sensor histidine kinase [Embleya scabrispora]|uniref:sensor histidine kinase n=1 Tax=Embleya scabrispora TaxID=159449 RepID=UPI00037F4268|nr:ATP-binding protein [Embleya scabrispora]
MGRTLLAFAAVSIITAGAVVWAVTAVGSNHRTAVAVGGVAVALALAIAVAATVYAIGTADLLRARIADMDNDAARWNDDNRDRMSAYEAEAAQLADETLPALVALLRGGASVDTALAGVPAPRHEALQRTLATVAREVGQGERMRAAAMSACANAAGRVQALSTSMLADLREMEGRHGEEVFGDLLRLDHSTAQAGRLADSIAVLTGARSGRRWTKPIVMESILRGAVGRISAYQRVRVHSTSEAAVAGYAAEGVMHALAELMDNATKFSPPSEQVHVYVEDVPAGVVVTVEDGGLVMGEFALRRAEQAVAAQSLDLTTLSGTRLGLAVVGCLARKHGLTVSFRPSSRGGTGVVMMIPRQLVGEVRPEPRKRAVPDARAAQARPVEAKPVEPAPAAAAPSVFESVVEPTPAVSESAPAPRLSGLAKRRPGQTLAAAAKAAERGESRSDAAPRAAKPRPAPGARFGAFRQAVQGERPGRDVTASPDDNS